MELKLYELEKHLQSELAPCYLVAGAELLLVLESCEKIRLAARQRGYEERVVMTADARFDWAELYAEASAMSLFSQKKLIDLRIPSGKPGREGGKAIQEFLKSKPDDTMLLVSCLTGDKSARQSAWAKAIGKAGRSMVVWPVELDKLPGWINQRMRSRDLVAEPGVVQFLSERVEGNLLAAAQEIDKLLVVLGPGSVTLEQAREQIGDSARFEVFGLFECAVSGNMRRAMRMLSGLRTEGTASVLVHWALTDQIRLMSLLSEAKLRGRSQDQILQQARVWASRRPKVLATVATYPTGKWHAMLCDCLQLDKIIKGRASGDFWMECERLLARLAARRRSRAA